MASVKLSPSPAIFVVHSSQPTVKMACIVFRAPRQALANRTGLVFYLSYEGEHGRAVYVTRREDTCPVGGKLEPLSTGDFLLICNSVKDIRRLAEWGSNYCEHPLHFCHYVMDAIEELEGKTSKRQIRAFEEHQKRQREEFERIAEEDRKRAAAEAKRIAAEEARQREIDRWRSTASW